MSETTTTRTTTTPSADPSDEFTEDMRRSRNLERRLLFKELVALLAVAAIIVVRQLWLS